VACTNRYTAVNSWFVKQQGESDMATDISSVARNSLAKLPCQFTDYDQARLYAAIQLATIRSDRVTLNTTMTLLLLLGCRKTDGHSFVNSI
jgi:hypothetical protein